MKITEILKAIDDCDIWPDHQHNMESKLRLLSELLPEIIANINVSLVFGNPAKVGAKRDLLAKLEVLENE